MTKKYEILLKYVKDLSVEIPSPDVFIFSKEFIAVTIKTDTTPNDNVKGS